MTIRKLLESYHGRDGLQPSIPSSDAPDLGSVQGIFNFFVMKDVKRRVIVCNSTTSFDVRLSLLQTLVKPLHPTRF